MEKIALSNQASIPYSHIPNDINSFNGNNISDICWYLDASQIEMLPIWTNVFVLCYLGLLRSNEPRTNMKISHVLLKNADGYRLLCDGCISNISWKLVTWSFCNTISICSTKHHSKMYACNIIITRNLHYLIRLNVQYAITFEYILIHGVNFFHFLSVYASLCGSIHGHTNKA